MIFYTFISIVMLLSLIIFIIYMFYSNRKGKHRKVTPPKTSVNYSKESSHPEVKEEKICILNKQVMKKFVNSKEIEINKNITKIEDNCFFKCFKLATIKVDRENKNYCSKAGVLFSKNMKKIICYPPLKQTSTYLIPEGVEEIENHAFFNNKFLKYIVLPTTLHSIGENSFINCKGINQIVIPDNVENIHPNAFNLCPRITVRCYKNSVAEDFCIKYLIPFEYLTN